MIEGSKHNQGGQFQIRNICVHAKEMGKQGDFHHICPTIFTSFAVTLIPTSLQLSFLHTWTLA